MKLKKVTQATLEGKEMVLVSEESYQEVVNRLNKFAKAYKHLQNTSNLSKNAKFDNQNVVAIDAPFFEKFTKEFPELSGTRKNGDPEIAKALKNIRLEKGFKKKDMAKKLGVTPAVIGLWESGVNSPKKSNLEKVKNKFPDEYKTYFKK